MKTAGSLFILSMVLFLVSGLAAQTRRPSMPEGIDKLHQHDISATLSSNVEELTALWTDDGVLIGAGAKPIAGKAAIRDFLTATFAKSPTMKVLTYEPEFEDLQVSGDFAYEWGYFNATQQASSTSQPANFRARFLRVLRRQLDGSWKFSRVMWSPDN